MGVESYYPKKSDDRSKQNDVPIIRGYLFVRWENKPFSYPVINQNPFTKDVLKDNNVPIEIPNEQVELMQKHVSSLYEQADFAAYQEGDLIQINFGLFNGHRGKIIEVNKNTITLYLSTSNSKVSIQYN